MSVKLANVAERTGFSVSTVSRALSGSRAVNGKTRHKIQRVFEQLQAHGTDGRGAARSRPKLLGLCTRMTGCDESHQSAFLREIQMMQEKAAFAGYGVMLAPYSDGRGDSVADAMIDDGLVAGVILLGAKVNDPFIHRLTKEKLPFILVHHFAEDSPYHSVGIDDSLAVQNMVKHLIEQGYREIAFLGASQERLPQRQKQAGFVAGLSACGIEPNPDWMLAVENTDTEDEARQHAHRLLSMSPRPRAILATTDQLAACVVETAHDLQLDVPRDVAVTGFDNRDIAATTIPALTTVHVPWNEMVTVATNQLIQLIDSGSYVEQVTVRLGTKLIVRESS